MTTTKGDGLVEPTIEWQTTCTVAPVDGGNFDKVSLCETGVARVAGARWDGWTFARASKSFEEENLVFPHLFFLVPVDEEEPDLQAPTDTLRRLGEPLMKLLS